MNNEYFQAKHSIAFTLGPFAHLFHGLHEQSYIYTVMTYAACLDQFENEEHCNNKYCKPSRAKLVCLCFIDFFSPWYDFINCMAILI